MKATGSIASRGFNRMVSVGWIGDWPLIPGRLPCDTDVLKSSKSRQDEGRNFTPVRHPRTFTRHNTYVVNPKRYTKVI